MSPDALDLELTREPFMPLRVHLADGSAFDIINPDLAVISKLVLHHFRPLRPGSRRGIDQMVVSLRNITKVEAMDPAEPA